MEKIAAIPGIAGVKEASGDINQIMEVINGIAAPRKNTANPFWVLSGDDAITLPFLAFGGDGLISVISNLVPRKLRAMVNACLSGNFEEGRKLHFELLPLMKNAFIETNPVPIKAAMNWAGLPSGPVRLPLGPLSENSEQVLRKALAGLGIAIK
jgi:4-hydroxy-tetrahydrodipicolinate synthase